MIELIYKAGEDLVLEDGPSLSSQDGFQSKKSCTSLSKQAKTTCCTFKFNPATPTHKTIQTLEMSSQVQHYHTGNVAEEHLCKSLKQSEKLLPHSLSALAEQHSDVLCTCACAHAPAEQFDMNCVIPEEAAVMSVTGSP